MIKYVSIFWLVLKCFLVPKKENLTGFLTGLTGRSKNLDPTGNPTGFHLWFGGEAPSRRRLGSGGKAPSRRRHGGLGAEPPALKNFAFFCKNN